jgi:hypothetical protein
MDATGPAMSPPILRRKGKLARLLPAKIASRVSEVEGGGLNRPKLSVPRVHLAYSTAKIAVALGAQDARLVSY